MAAASLTFHLSAYAEGMRQLPHAHGELHLSLVLRGSVAESVGGETEYAGALSIVAKDPGVVHADTFGESGALVARLSIPDRGLGDVADDRARAAPWRWAHDAAVAAPFIRLVERSRAGVSRFAADDGDIVDLVAALTARPSPPPTGRPPLWLREAIDSIREGRKPALTVAEVARVAGVHPVYLARCMRRWYGTTAGGELRRVRLHRAAGALAGDRYTVSAIAHESGYADEPHLCRDLSHTAGITPGRFRRLVRSVEGAVETSRRR